MAVRFYRERTRGEGFVAEAHERQIGEKCGPVRLGKVKLRLARGQDTARAERRGAKLAEGQFRHAVKIGFGGSLAWFYAGARLTATANWPPLGVGPQSGPVCSRPFHLSFAPDCEAAECGAAGAADACTLARDLPPDGAGPGSKARDSAAARRDTRACYIP